VTLIFIVDFRYIPKEWTDLILRVE